MAYGGRRNSARDAGISFPQLECWSPITNSATFAAQVDGRRVLCRIGTSTLRERSPELATEPMKALAQNRAAFQAAARRIIEREGYEEDGTVVIRDADL